MPAHKCMFLNYRKSSLSLLKKMIHYVDGPLLEDLCNQAGSPGDVSFATSLTEVMANVLDVEVSM